MKFREQSDGTSVSVVMSGELEVDSCTCLENYWTLRLAGHRSIRVDMGAVTGGDDAALTTLERLVRGSLAEGARVTLHGAPVGVAGRLAPLSEDGLELPSPRRGDDDAPERRAP